MSNETTLLPCPFCGGEAEPFNPFDNIDGTWTVLCGKCASSVCFEQTEAEAIAAWNTRADYHGYEQAAIEAWESIKAWNARAERTCRNDKDKWSGLAKYLFVCSECGWNLVDVGNDAIDISARLMKRCPMCGAKVIG